MDRTGPNLRTSPIRAQYKHGSFNLLPVTDGLIPRAEEKTSSLRAQVISSSCHIDGCPRKGPHWRSTKVGTSVLSGKSPAFQTKAVNIRVY